MKTTWKMGESVVFETPPEGQELLGPEAEGTLVGLRMSESLGDLPESEATISVPGFPYEVLCTVPMEKVRDA